MAGDNRDLAAVQLFDPGQIFLFLRGAEADGSAVGTGTGRAANAVDVAFRILGNIEIHHVGDIVNINILVMGPSGTGKTSALLIPTLRSWQSRRHPHHLLARSQVCKFTFENRKTPNISRNCSLSGRFGTFLFDMRGFTMVGKPAIAALWQ